MPKSDEVKIEIIDEGTTSSWPADLNLPESVDLTDQFRSRENNLRIFLSWLGVNDRTLGGIFRQDSFEEDVDWWGGGQKGQQRINRHRKDSSTLRDDLTQIMSKIEELPAPERVFDSIREKANERLRGLSLVKDEQNPPNASEEHSIQIIDNPISYEVDVADTTAFVNQSYEDLPLEPTYQTTFTHEKQKYVGSNYSGKRIYSCVMRNILTGAKAVGADLAMTEENLIDMVGIENFDGSGFFHVFNLPDLNQKIPQLIVTDLTSTLEVIQTLVNGGTVISAIPQEAHSILFSGIRNSTEGIEIMKNDPFGSEGVWVKLEEFVRSYDPHISGTAFYALFNSNEYERDVTSPTGDIKGK